VGVDDLTVQLERLLDAPDLVADYRKRALVRAEIYSWDAVTDQYEDLLRTVCAARASGFLPDSLVDREPLAA